MRALGNDDEQIVIAPCPSSSLVSLGGGSHVETTKKNHLWLAVGCKGGGGGSHIETMKMTSSGSHLVSHRQSSIYVMCPTDHDI